jgi:ankyrin repeat protein
MLSECVSEGVGEGVSKGGNVSDTSGNSNASGNVSASGSGECVSEGVNILAQLTEDGRTALMISAFEGNIDILRIIQKYAPSLTQSLTSTLHINAVDTHGNTALHHCCFGGSVECGQYLVSECGADPFQRNSEGMLPIHFAAAGNHTSLVRYLHQLSTSSVCECVSKGEGKCSGECKMSVGEGVSESSSGDNTIATATATSDSGINTLHRAAMHGSLETLQLLINEQLTAVNSTTLNMNTALHLASQRGMLNIVDFLLTHSVTQASEGVGVEVDVNAQNQYGLSPLHFACIGGYSGVVKCLLQHGAVPTLCSASGATPLHLASSAGSHECCELLVKSKHTVDLWAEDSDGE